MGRSMSPIPACFVKFQWFIWTISCSRGEYKRKSFCNPMYRATMNSWLAPAAPKCPKLWQYFAEISLLFKLTSLSPNFSQSSFICVKSRTVVPHNDATFSIRTTFPCSELNLNWKNHCGQTIYLENHGWIQQWEMRPVTRTGRFEWESGCVIVLIKGIGGSV